MPIHEIDRRKDRMVFSKSLESKQIIDNRLHWNSDDLHLKDNLASQGLLKFCFSNQEFYLKYDSNGDATFGCTKDLTIIYWSKGAEKLLGYSADEVIGIKMSRFLPDNQYSRIKKIFARLEKGETIKNYESVRKHKDGTFIPVEISVTPFYNKNGDFYGVFIEYRDITDKIKLLNKLKSAEELWRRAILGGKFGVWEWHIKSDEFIFHNQWYHTLGLHKGEVKNQLEDWLRLVHKEDIPTVRRMIHDALKGMDYVCEFRMLAKNGHYIWVRGKGNVTDWDEKGNPMIMVGTNEVITDRKQIEEQLEEKCRQLELAKKEAELADKTKTNFLSGISHEIRTPMNGILGIIQLLKNTKLDQKQVKWLNMLQTAVDGQMSIINNMLDIAKIEAGKVEPERSPFNVKVLIEEVYEQLRVLCKPKRLEARLSIDCDIKHMVIGDKVIIKQILLNLINNAVKFTDHGTITIEVCLLSSYEEMESIVFKVIDTGIGISAKNIDKIFDSYYQGDLSSKKKHMGTGLGLTISKQLALLMDGDIEVDSILGHGSTFRYYCNFYRYKKPNRSTDEKDLDIPIDTETIHDKLSMDGKVIRNEIILSIEDNEINQEIVEAVLQHCGFQLLTAGSGEEALRLIEKYHVDIILMDVQMPGMNGYQLAKVIREKDGFYHIPIIAMTAHTTDTERSMCLESGMNDFIAKPIEVKQLLRTICKYID